MASKVGKRPTPPMSTPPTTPPNGIRAKHIAVDSEDTRPTSGCGIRSKITAPRTGLMNPAATPDTATMATSSASGASNPKAR